MGLKLSGEVRRNTSPLRCRNYWKIRDLSRKGLFIVLALVLSRSYFRNSLRICFDSGNFFIAPYLFVL
jgi:hypothetical protein